MKAKRRRTLSLEELARRWREYPLSSFRTGLESRARPEELPWDRVRDEEDRYYHPDKFVAAQKLYHG